MPYVIPRTSLLVAGDFSARLRAERVAATLSAGILALGAPQPEVLTLSADPSPAGALSDRPDPQSFGLGISFAQFDAQMRRSRALLLALACLAREQLASSPVFELATRARQAGVPAYAVTAHNGLEPFDARILDLQVILQASSPGALRTAGQKLAQIV
jgi:hypothetical protein